MKRLYSVQMDNGNIYAVPAEVIAEKLGDMSLLQQFDSGEFEFAETARTKLAWADVAPHAVLLKKNSGEPCDLEKGWKTGPYLYQKE